VKNIDDIIQLALKEDVGGGDITTGIFVPDNIKFKAVMKAKKTGVVCGVDVAERVFKTVDPSIKVTKYLKDGDRVRKGSVIMRVTGGKSIMTAERTALNFIQHLSGIATLTNKFAKAVSGFSEVYDTRKTIPGLRDLEKYAVRCGAGKNHRKGLYDAFLIKDNHISSLGRNYLSELSGRIRKARRNRGRKKIEIEAKTLKQAKEFSKLDVDMVMLDNMSLSDMRKAIVFLRRRKKQVEISGNVNLRKVRALAKLKPDRISAGKITHSAPALDISLDIANLKER